MEGNGGFFVNIIRNTAACGTSEW